MSITESVAKDRAFNRMVKARQLELQASGALDDARAVYTAAKRAYAARLRTAFPHEAEAKAFVAAECTVKVLWDALRAAAGAADRATAEYREFPCG
jgi:hypothetical protein